jgi:hypothetical protein
MPLGDDKTTVTAVISTEVKEKLKDIARLRRWTLSQAVGALIEDNMDRWVEELGLTLEPANKSKKKSKSVS